MAREQVGALVMLYVAYVVFADDTPVQLEAGAPAPAIRRSLWGTSGEARSPQSPDRRMREVLTLLQLTPLAAINKTNTTKCAKDLEKCEDMSEMPAASVKNLCGRKLSVQRECPSYCKGFRDACPICKDNATSCTKLLLPAFVSLSATNKTKECKRMSNVQSTNYTNACPISCFAPCPLTEKEKKLKAIADAKKAKEAAAARALAKEKKTKAQQKVKEGKDKVKIKKAKAAAKIKAAKAKSDQRIHARKVRRAKAAKAKAAKKKADDKIQADKDKKKAMKQAVAKAKVAAQAKKKAAKKKAKAAKKKARAAKKARKKKAKLAAKKAKKKAKAKRRANARIARKKIKAKKANQKAATALAAKEAKKESKAVAAKASAKAERKLEKKQSNEQFTAKKMLAANQCKSQCVDKCRSGAEALDLAKAKAAKASAGDVQDLGDSYHPKVEARHRAVEDAIAEAKSSEDVRKAMTQYRAEKAARDEASRSKREAEKLKAAAATVTADESQQKIEHSHNDSHKVLPEVPPNLEAIYPKEGVMTTIQAAAVNREKFRQVREKKLNTLREKKAAVFEEGLTAQAKLDQAQEEIKHAANMVSEAAAERREDRAHEKYAVHEKENSILSAAVREAKPYLEAAKRDKEEAQQLHNQTRTEARQAVDQQLKGLATKHRMQKNIAAEEADANRTAVLHAINADSRDAMRKVEIKGEEEKQEALQDKAEAFAKKLNHEADEERNASDAADKEDKKMSKDEAAADAAAKQIRQDMRNMANPGAQKSKLEMCTFECDAQCKN